MAIYPLVFEPVLVPKIWGGRNLERLFGRRLPAGQKIGESWEVADLPEGVSAVAVGPQAGRSLHDLVVEWGGRLLGRTSLAGGRFPLLVKFVDAEEALSVQVHPDEQACERIGGDARVKHEAWYVIETRGDAVIYAGLKGGVTRERFRQAVAEGTVEQTLHQIRVKAGDCYYLPSGTVHALGAGVVVAEVQTPSDTTYRVFDWDRLGQADRPRALNVDEAIRCIHFGEPPPVRQPRRHVSDAWTTTTRLAECPQFVLDKVRVSEGFEQRLDVDQMLVWQLMAGRCRLSTTGLDRPIVVQAGQCVVIPAAASESVLTAEADSAWLQAAVPA